MKELQGAVAGLQNKHSWLRNLWGRIIRGFKRLWFCLYGDYSRQMKAAMRPVVLSRRYE